MTFPADLKTLLTGAGLSNIVNGQLPHSPDDVIMTRVTGGFEALETHDSVVYERPTAQVLVRASTFAIAWSRALTAQAALRKRNFVVNGTRYLSLKPTDGLVDLGKDSQKPGRHEVSFNITAVMGV